MAYNLTGMSVLVTRPEPQGSELCRLIKSCGGDAVNFPVVEFAPPPAMNAFIAAVTELGEQDFLIFNSPRSVIASVPTIRQYWPYFPPQVRFAAVGEGTARALREAGYNVQIVPSNEWSSESLLDLPAFQRSAVAGKKIAIIRGEGGRELLDKVLLERGAEVTPVIAYQRVLPQIDINPFVTLIKEHKINSIVCTSFEGVRNMRLLLGVTTWPYLKEVPLLVVSERIKILARDLGFQTIWVSRNASQKTILESLANMR